VVVVVQEAQELVVEAAVQILIFFHMTFVPKIVAMAQFRLSEEVAPQATC
jgi:hypothetical protein